MKPKKLNIPSRIYLFLVYLMLYTPIAVLIIFSFNKGNSTSILTGFSLNWYYELFRDAATMEALKNTLVLAVLSSIISTVLGTLTTVGYVKSKTKWYKRALKTATNIPMMNPDIVTGISMMLLFVFAGSLMGRKGVLGFGTMLIAHITFQLPYVILNIIPRFRNSDPYLTEAAIDLGCTPSQAFFKITMPQIKPGIISGLLMAFTLSLDDFVISYFVCGPDYQTLPIRIYSMTKKRVTPDIYALSTLMFVTMLVLLILVNLSEDGERKTKRKRRKIEELEMGKELET